VKLDLDKNSQIDSPSNLNDDDSQIINIFKKELNSSNSAGRKQSSKGKQRRTTDDELFLPIPLKELKPTL